MTVEIVLPRTVGANRMATLEASLGRALAARDLPRILSLGIELGRIGATIARVTDAGGEGAEPCDDAESEVDHG